MGTADGGYLLIADPLTVGYRRKTGEGAYVSGSVAYARFEGVTADYQQALGVPLDVRLGVFHLWAVPLSGTVPQNGDKIVVASGALSGAYTVLHREVLGRGSRYKLTCQGDV